MEKTQHTDTPVEHEHHKTKMSPFGHLFRIIGMWFGFSGLYAMFAVCPFCGQHGCPTGIASAGAIGAFFTLCLQDWKRLFAYIKQKIKKSQTHQSGTV